MKEKQIAKAYAKSVIELGDSMKVDVAEELTTLTETINASNELENVLFLDVFTPEEKASVLESITKRLGLSQLSTNFLSFLLSERRIGLFPLIYKELVVLDDHRKGFIRGVVEGVDEKCDDEILKKISSYVSEKLKVDAELVYQQCSNISAGYRVTVEDLQLDATLDNQLEQLKTSILGE